MGKFESEFIFRRWDFLFCCFFFQSADVGAVLRAHYDGGKLVAAICAAPIALESHAIAPGCLITSHPSVKNKLIEGGNPSWLFHWQL